MNLIISELEEQVKELQAKLEESQKELTRYKECAQSIFNDPIAYMENKSILWKERAQELQAKLDICMRVAKGEEDVYLAIDYEGTGFEKCEEVQAVYELRKKYDGLNKLYNNTIHGISGEEEVEA